MSYLIENISLEPEKSEIIDINIAFWKREQKASQEVQLHNDILQEWVPQMEALCERHQTAFQMFCESEKWFFPILKTYNLWE